MILKDGKIVSQEINQEYDFEDNVEDEVKIYCLKKEEQLEYIKNNTDGLNGFNLNEVKQIETDYWNNVYVLKNNGDLYINTTFSSSGVDRIYVFDGFHLYRIQKNNTIVPIGDVEEWDNLDIYLYNNYEVYKKIVEMPLCIIGLTEDKRVLALSFSINYGIVPENFINVDDIYLKEDEKGNIQPYILKNGIETSLFVM